ncbi:MAG: flagellar hook-associated protein FlgK [Clostridia bacterium]|nr:flagellar hook-associated protein FlgK [Clostridia bacterium]
MITGSFVGLNLSMRGLYASQKALNLTAQNIANSSTEGYTRRVAEFKTFGQDRDRIGDPGFGMGGDFISATRMRDEYLDKKIWNQQSIASEWSIKNEYYTNLQQIVNEPSVSDLTTNLTDFYSAMDEFAKEPSSTTKRYLVLNRGLQLTTYFNEVATKLEEFQVELNDSVKMQVDEINSIADKLRDLNEKIYNTEISGGDAGFMRDERALLIDQLSEYGNVEVSEMTYGELINGSEDRRMTILFGGTVLVDHKTNRHLEYSKRITAKNEADVEGLYEVSMQGGARLDLTSGKLKATLEVRDGNVANGDSWVKGVPYYMEQLDTIARTFAKAFNEGIKDYNQDGAIDPDTEKGNGFADAYTFNSKEGDDVPGIRFFSIDSLSSADFINGKTDLDDINSVYDGLNAKNISISKDILEDIGNMFKSFTDSGNNNDTEAIQDLMSFTSDKKLFGTTDVNDFVAGMITNLGVDAQLAKDLDGSHEAVITQLTNRRESYSGVSLNEEATNLVKFQQMYNASAKVMSVFSEIYNTLVNTI